jgi:hypothetical protein
MVCLALLFLSLGMAARSARGDDNQKQAVWDKLKQLSAGQEIQVVQKGAQSSQGTFRSVNEEAIVVNQAGGEQTIDRQSVVRVSTKGRGHRKRNALIGAGIGAGAGAGIGAGIDSSCNCANGFLPSNTGVYVLAPLGAIVGAIIGAVIPSGGWHEVYRAR